MTIGKLLTDVVTVGGEQKAESIRDAAKKLGSKLEDAMYVGDSITDVEAFQLVRKNGGLSVSFNGNSYAVRAAEVAVQSESNLVTAALADTSANMANMPPSKQLRAGVCRHSKAQKSTQRYWHS